MVGLVAPQRKEDHTLPQRHCDQGTLGSCEKPSFVSQERMIHLRFQASVLALSLCVCAHPALADFRLLSGDANNNPTAESIVLQDVSHDGTKTLFVATPPQFGESPGVAVGGLYRRNLVTDTLTFVGDNTVDALGILEASMSDSGRFVAWGSGSDSEGVNHIYWRDTLEGTTVKVTAGADKRSRRPILSGDGRFVAFASEARNLVLDTATLPAEGLAAIYLYDSQDGSIVTISVTSTGVGLATGVGAGTIGQGAWLDFDMTRDAKFLVFTSGAGNVTPESTNGFWVYRRNLEDGSIVIVNRTSAGAIAPATYSRTSISDDGDRIAFIGAFIGIFGDSISDQVAATFGNEALTKEISSGDVWWVTRTLDESPLNGTSGGNVKRTIISGDGSVVGITAVSTNLVEDDVFPDTGTRDSFDIYRVELGESRATSTSHINRPADDANENVGLRSDAMMPGNAAYIAYGTNDTDVALDIPVATTLAEQQAVGVGDFSNLGGGTTTTTIAVTTSTMPVAFVCGDADGSGTLNASDALTALKTAVGLDDCPVSVCDVNGDGNVRSSDALSILRKAVGLDVMLTCLPA